jgi:hypothetical protein
MDAYNSASGLVRRNRDPEKTQEQSTGQYQKMLDEPESVPARHSFPSSSPESLNDMISRDKASLDRQNVYQAPVLFQRPVQPAQKPMQANSAPSPPPDLLDL